MCLAGDDDEFLRAWSELDCTDCTIRTNKPTDHRITLENLSVVSCELGFTSRCKRSGLLSYGGKTQWSYSDPVSSGLQRGAVSDKERLQASAGGRPSNKEWV